MPTGFEQFFPDDQNSAFALQLLYNALQDEARPELASANPADFRDQAESESGDFFDENLRLLNKDIELQKRQAEETKAQAEAFQTENLGVFQNIQDKNFARTLNRAQSGFAGRGTAGSGFARGNIQDLDTDNQQELADADRGARQATEERSLRFDQFLDDEALRLESGTLDINRSRETDIISRQNQIANQTQAQNENLIQQSDRNFARTTFGDFLSQKGAAW